MKKIKVLFFMHKISGGGAQRVVQKVTSNLDANTYDITHASLESSKKTSVNGVRYVKFEKSRVLTSIFDLYRLVKELNPKYVFSSMPHTSIVCLLVCKIKNIKFIYRESNYINYVTKKSLSWKLIYKLIYRFSDVIISQSYAMETENFNYLGIKKERSVVINNPVEFVELSNKEIYSIDKNKYNFVYIGRNNWQKGTDLLLSEDLIIPDGALLHIVGFEKPEGFNGKKIKFWGYLDEPYQLLASCDCLILPSRFEGFPNVLLEAMYFGKKIIVNKCKGIDVDLCKSYGGVTFLDELSTKDINVSMHLIINSTQTEVNKSVLNDFSLDKVILEYNKLFN
ncbi:glycosyltransferase [Vibrio breoganii]